MAKEKTGGIAQLVETLVRPTIEALDLRLWDVRFEKEGPDWFLRVFIDRDTPLDTDACEAATRAINPLLDEADPIVQSYYLEVGSPGLGRRLVRDEHFAAKAQQKVLAHLIRPNESGERDITGVLQGKTDTVVCLLREDGSAVEIDAKDASYFKLCDDDDLF